MSQPQISLFMLPDGTIAAEAPGRNGTREKLGQFDLHSLPPEIVACFIDQRDRASAEVERQKQIAKREAKLRRERIFATTWHTHDLDLALRVVPEYVGKFDPISGKIISPPRPERPAPDLSALE